MLNIKSLVATVLLSGLAAASFAQAPVAATAPVTTTAVTATAIAKAPAEAAAKPVKKHVKKTYAAKVEKTDTTKKTEALAK